MHTIIFLLPSLQRNQKRAETNVSRHNSNNHHASLSKHSTFPLAVPAGDVYNTRAFCSSKVCFSTATSTITYNTQLHITHTRDTGKLPFTSSAVVTAYFTTNCLLYNELPTLQRTAYLQLFDCAAPRMHFAPAK